MKHIGETIDFCCGSRYKIASRLSENAHLPFDKPFDGLTVLSRVEGLMALSKVDPST